MNKTKLEALAGKSATRRRALDSPSASKLTSLTSKNGARRREAHAFVEPTTAAGAARAIGHARKSAPSLD